MGILKYSLIASKSDSFCDFRGLITLLLPDLILMAQKSVNYRSAITGRYVKERYAKSHPKTTVKETNKNK